MSTLQHYGGKENVSSEMQLDADEVHEEMKRCKPAMAGYSFRCSARSVIVFWISKSVSIISSDALLTAKRGDGFCCCGARCIT